MKYYILTYGCQMNYSDSEKIAAQLKNSGHKPSKNAETADIIAVNFCSVRQSAVHRALAQLHKYKNKQLIVAGCLLPEDQKKITAKKAAAEPMPSATSKNGTASPAENTNSRNPP